MNTAHHYNPAFTKTPDIAKMHGFDDDSYDMAQVETTQPLIPAEVIRQLREHGVNICTLSAGHLTDAINSYRDDGVVFDDPEGHNFHDQLHLSDDEAKRGRGRGKHSFWSNNVREDERPAPLTMAA